MIRLQDLIPPSYLILIFYFGMALLSFSTAWLLLFLIMRKKRQTEQQATRGEYRKTFVALVNDYLTDSSVMFSPLSKDIEFEILSDVCIGLLLSLSGDMEARMQLLIKRMALVEYLQKQAASRNWLVRYQAIERLGFIKNEDLKPYFLELLTRETQDEVRTKLVWALSRIADEEALSQITGELTLRESNSAKFNQHIYVNIIQSLRRRDQVARFITFLNLIRMTDRVPTILKRDIIDACGSAGLQEAVKTIIDYGRIEPANPELKIACLRALGKLGNSEAGQFVMANLYDDDWRIRVVAASAASLCPPEAIDKLRRLLRDRDYYVRINASKSLAKFGSAGLAALEAESQSPDRFVRDAARFMLAEKGTQAHV